MSDTPAPNRTMRNLLDRRAAVLAAIGVAVAAEIDRTGVWTWGAATPNWKRQGQVAALNLAEADELIATELAQVLPQKIASYSLRPYRRQRNTKRGRPRQGKGDQTRRGQIASIRPWETLPPDYYLPVCGRTLNALSAHDTSLRDMAISLRHDAEELLPPSAIHPGMRSIQLPAGELFSPWTVATDGSLRNGVAGWAFVTGTGWTDWDSTHAGASSSTAEFTAYCHALAIYPDGSEVTLITDSASTGTLLQEIAEAARPGRLGRHLQQPRHRPADITQSVFDRTMLHARRLRLTVQWSRRNTHPLQTSAHRICNQITQSGPLDADHGETRTQ